MCSVPRYISIAAFALVFVQVGTSQAHRYDSKRSPSSIRLSRVLAPATPCRTFQRPIQFFSETSLLVLSGSPGDCYRSVDQIELNLISIDGHLLVRKPWPSTDPGVIIDSGRLVLVTPATIEVDDKDLTPIQSIELPPHRFMPTFLRSDQENAITVEMDGDNYIFGGKPLALLRKEPPRTTRVETAFTFSDGQVIIRDDDSLNLLGEGHTSRKIGSLEWVFPPCKGYLNCQAWGAGGSIQVSTGEKRRILVYSNGSKLPITDAAGLFPYFRLQVFDFDTGKEIYRQQDFLRTGERSAAISPDGYRLATTDGNSVVIRDLR